MIFQHGAKSTGILEMIIVDSIIQFFFNFQALVQQIKKISAEVFGNESLFLIWSLCLILMLIVWVAEFFAKKMIRHDYIDRNILRKIFLAIEVKYNLFQNNQN